MIHLIEGFFFMVELIQSSVYTIIDWQLSSAACILMSKLDDVCCCSHLPVNTAGVRPPIQQLRQRQDRICGLNEQMVLKLRPLRLVRTP